MMEEWNTGTMGAKEKKKRCSHIIPLFQHSNIPILRGGSHGTVR
jgi:hypothetical protein